MAKAFFIRQLAKEDRSQFDCGVEALNSYFQRQVSQDVKRKACSCFLAFDEANENIAGFYTLSACHTDLSALPDEWRKKIAPYPRVPTVLIGRLAVDKYYHGHKLGSALILDAAKRASNSEVAVSLLAVDAKDEAAERFYMHHGFMRDPNTPNSMFILLKSLFGAKPKSTIRENINE